MDDLRRSLGPFDPDAPLTGAPEPWDFLPMPGLRKGSPWAMTEMIAAEPALVERVARRVAADGSAERLATLVRDAARAGGPIVVTGCGTSELAAMATAALLREAWMRAGLPGWGPVATQAFELALDPPTGGLAIGCSHEGGTEATIAALAAAQSRGARTAVITASSSAPASVGRDLVIATHELDRSWCHTIGYVSPIAAAAVTADLLTGDTPRPDWMRRRLATGIEAAHAVGPDGVRPDAAIGSLIARAARLLVVASGTDRITAREVALKVEEASWLPAVTRDLETFLHGHLPATGPDTALLLLLLERAGLPARARRARQALRAAAAVGIRPVGILGAEAATLIPDDLTPGGRIVVPEASERPGATAALLGAAAPIQLVTLAVSAARGINPDAIRRDEPAYLRAAELADDPDG